VAVFKASNGVETAAPAAPRLPVQADLRLATAKGLGITRAVSADGQPTESALGPGRGAIGRTQATSNKAVPLECTRGQVQGGCRGDKQGNKRRNECGAHRATPGEEDDALESN
jgi:hypothetical protein